MTLYMEKENNSSVNGKKDHPAIRSFERIPRIKINSKVPILHGKRKTFQNNGDYYGACLKKVLDN